MAHSPDVIFKGFHHRDALRAKQESLNFLSPAAIQTVPVLLLVVALGWATSFVMIYPPGALVVVSRPFQAFQDPAAPVFDGSYIGPNGSYSSLASANNYSINGLGVLDYNPPDGENFEAVWLAPGFV